jgi:hypothetical protein
VIGDRDRDQEYPPSAHAEAAKTAAKKAAKHGGRKLFIALGVTGGFWVGVVVLLLLVIAALFGVPVDYFFNSETAAKIDADLRLLTAVRDVGVQGVALRASGLSAESLASLEGIIDQVRKFERLPEQGGNGEEGEPPP